MKSLSLAVATLLITAAASAGVVVPVGTSSQVLIPAAGSTQGANGLFFRSDITIINLGTTDATLAVQWLPQAGNGTVSTTTITVPARSGIRAPSGDFVADYLHQSGLGSIIITATNGTGGVDTNARLYVSARIWSNQPNTTGTTSQSFPAIPLNSINNPAIAFFGVGGADNPGNYRVNVGVVNVDPNFTQTFFVTVPGSSPALGVTVTLPPLTMTQVSLGSGLSPTSQIQVLNTTPGSLRSSFWTAYVSTVDNTTGDAWSEVGVAITPAP